MKPQNSLILGKYEEPKDKQTGTGIYIPDTANNATSFLRSGEVLAINRKEEVEEKDIKVGDKVLFNKNALAPVPTVDNEYLVRKEDIYAVI